MNIVNQSYEILTVNGGKSILRNIEVIGRTCYKSENRITIDSSEKFVAMLIKNGHESVLEHEYITVRFICDRGISHELVRHRLASFTQESTRFCNYSKDKFDNQITVINQEFVKDSALYIHWSTACRNAELSYFSMLKCGATPQEARSVLPTCLKTELIITANLREWRLIFKQRTSKAAHPQMRMLMTGLLTELRDMIPIIFDDI